MLFIYPLSSFLFILSQDFCPIAFTSFLFYPRRCPLLSSRASFLSFDKLSILSSQAYLPSSLKLSLVSGIKLYILIPFNIFSVLSSFFFCTNYFHLLFLKLSLSSQAFSSTLSFFLNQPHKVARMTIMTQAFSCPCSIFPGFDFINFYVLNLNIY
jgi:hypothetical protein